jgi:hypothetical protein
MIEVIIPGEAPSTPNLREHHMARARRVKNQRAKVMAKVPTWGGGPLLFVRLTRVAPRRLDDDNLAGALKGHRDAVAARLRVDDASPLVGWEYQQATGEPAVVVQIWASTEEEPDRYTAVRRHPEVKGELKLASNSDLPQPREAVWEKRKPTQEDNRRAVLRVLEAEDRALAAAQQAEETFAPGCGNCGSCMECMRPVP